MERKKTHIVIRLGYLKLEMPTVRIIPEEEMTCAS